VDWWVSIGLDAGSGEDLSAEDLQTGGELVWSGRSSGGAAGDGDDDHRGARSTPVELTTWVFEAGTKKGQLARAQRAIEDLTRERDSALYRVKEVGGRLHLPSRGT